MQESFESEELTPFAIDCTRFGVFCPNVWEDMQSLPDVYLRWGRECAEDFHWLEQQDSFSFVA